MEHNKFNEEDLNDLKTVLTEIRSIRMMLEDHLMRSRINEEINKIKKLINHD